MNDSAFRVETAPRLAQWRIDTLSSSSFTFRKSNAFPIGLWNWYLSVERNKQQLHIRLYPENTSLTRERPPIASFVIRIISCSSGTRRTLVHPGVCDKQLKTNEDFVWVIDAVLAGKFIVDVEFLDLKVASAVGGDPTSIWSGGSITHRSTTTALASLSRMLTDAINADITIHASDGGTLPAHRAILSSRSPVFLSMFSHASLRESSLSAVHIPEMSSPSCRAFLEYVYGGLSPEDFHTHRLDLLGAADKYDVADLREACEESLAEDVGAGNVLERLQCAHLYGLPRLKAACMRCLVGFGKVFDVREELSGFLQVADRELVAEVFHEILAAWKGF